MSEYRVRAWVYRPGCPLCRDQAQQLSKLKPIFDECGVGMVAVVHEMVPLEDVTGFRSYFAGPVYFDEAKGFYMAQGLRWLGFHALLWPCVIRAIMRANKRNVVGTTGGEGRLLGGMLLVSTRDVHFEHREQVRATTHSEHRSTPLRKVSTNTHSVYVQWFGDQADLVQLAQAAASCVGKEALDTERIEALLDQDADKRDQVYAEGGTSCS
jgi:hypothetical protein